NGPQGTSALIGDLNGDGFADLLRSGAAEYSSDPLLLQGSVGVVFGNGGGRPVRPAQRRGDGSGIAVAPGGSAYSPDSFVVELIARSPRSSERAKLEVEVCPLATAFGDPACMAQTSASWISLGSSGTLLSHAVTGLAAEE